MYKKISHLCLLTILIAVSSCSNFIYKANTSQGFIPDAGKIKNIKVGMSQQQVVSLIGKPTIKNALYPNKWSYVEVIDIGDDKTMTKSFSLTFSGNRLVAIKKAI